MRFCRTSPPIFLHKKSLPKRDHLICLKLSICQAILPPYLVPYNMLLKGVNRPRDWTPTLLPSLLGFFWENKTCPHRMLRIIYLMCLKNRRHESRASPLYHLQEKWGPSLVRCSRRHLYKPCHKESGNKRKRAIMPKINPHV